MTTKERKKAYHAMLERILEDLNDSRPYTQYYIGWVYAGLGGHGSSEIPHCTLEEAYAEIEPEIERMQCTWDPERLRTVEAEFGSDGNCPMAYIEVLTVDNAVARAINALHSA